MLRLDHVSKSYRVGTFGSRELPAVRDVSLGVAPGEVVSLTQSQAKSFADRFEPVREEQPTS